MIKKKPMNSLFHEGVASETFFANRTEVYKNTLVHLRGLGGRDHF